MLSKPIISNSKNISDVDIKCFHNIRHVNNPNKDIWFMDTNMQFIVNNYMAFQSSKKHWSRIDTEWFICTSKLVQIMAWHKTLEHMPNQCLKHTYLQYRPEWFHFFVKSWFCWISKGSKLKIPFLCNTSTDCVMYTLRANVGPAQLCTSSVTAVAP